MADDAQTVITLLTWTGTPPTATPVSFYATRDQAGNYTLQSTPRVMGAQVDSGNPMPVADAAAETALAAIEISTAQGATAAGQAAMLTDLAAILAKLQGTLTASLGAGTNAIGTVGITGNVAVTDTSGAAFQGSSVITPGTATTAGRSVAYVCTAAGNITITLPDESTMTFGIAASPDLQTLPFAVTLLTLGSGTAGTFWTVR